MTTYAELNRCLARRSLPGAAGHHGEIKKLIERFIAQHLKQQCPPPILEGRPAAVPGSSSAHQASKEDDDRPDDLGPIVDTIIEHVGPASHGTAATGGAQQLLNLLVVLRILLRRAANRRGMPRRGVKAVVDLLGEPRSAAVVKECFRVVLQMCYEQPNVLRFTEYGGVSVLLRFLTRLSDEELQANLLGALQSICYQAVGRHAVREGDGIPAIARFLASPNPKVHARAVGSIHNLTADARALSTVRLSGAIPCLIPMLSSPLQEVCSAAAGALQNLSREPIARQLIEEGGALAPLTDLLTSADVHCQACAAGALYNLLVHKAEEQEGGLGKFKTLLADAIVLGMVRSCLLDDDDGQAGEEEEEEGAAAGGPQQPWP